VHDPFDLGFDCTPEFKPNMISIPDMPRIFQGVPDSVRAHGKQLLSEGWKIYAVKQKRGRCYYKGKAGVITIPVWAINRAMEYKTWYICHELAHAFDKTKSNHGPEFMRILQEICPANCVHFEIGYKPRNAIAAGIRKPGDVDPFELFS
jgi:hypothetical protein